MERSEFQTRTKFEAQIASVERELALTKKKLDHEEEERDIAEMEGLKKGIREWDVSFRWSDVDNRYIWHILSTHEELESGDRYKGKGEEIIIDPNNGAVIEKRDWELK